MASSVVLAPASLAGQTFQAFYTTPCFRAKPFALPNSVPNLALADAKVSTSNYMFYDYNNLTIFGGNPVNQSFAIVIATDGIRQGYFEQITQILWNLIAATVSRQFLVAVIFQIQNGDASWASYLAVEFWAQSSSCVIPAFVVSAQDMPIEAQEVTLARIEIANTLLHHAVSSPYWITFLFIPSVAIPVVLLSLIVYKTKRLRETGLITRSVILLNVFGITQAATLLLFAASSSLLQPLPWLSWLAKMILLLILILGSNYSTFVISLSYFSAIRAIERQSILTFKGLRQYAPWAAMLVVSILFFVAMVENITATNNYKNFFVFAWSITILFRGLLLVFFVISYVRAILLLRQKALDSNFPQIAAITGAKRMIRYLIILGTLNLALIFCLIFLGTTLWTFNYGFVMWELVAILIGTTGAVEIGLIPTPPKGVKTLKMQDTQNEDDELARTGEIKLKVSPKAPPVGGPNQLELKQVLVDHTLSASDHKEAHQ